MLRLQEARGPERLHTPDGAVEVEPSPFPAPYVGGKIRSLIKSRKQTQNRRRTLGTGSVSLTSDSSNHGVR